MEKNREMKVSMLLDDELNEQEALSLLDQIEYDDGLKDKWFRYNTASLAMKSESAVALQPGLVDKVRQAIAYEQGGRAAPIARLKPARRYNLRGYDILVGALAASVMIIAVIVVKEVPDMSSEVDVMTVADKGAVSGLHQVQASARQSPEARFHGYLLNHNESAYSMGTRGMLPYARVVRYGAKQR